MSNTIEGALLNMGIRVKHKKNIVVLYPEGNLDIKSSSFIDTARNLMREGHSKIICNFKGVQSIDYNGLTVIDRAYKSVVNKGGSLKFCAASTRIQKLFEIVRLDLVFEIHADEGMAVKAFEVVSKINKLHLRRRFSRLELQYPVKFFLHTTVAKRKYSGRILNIGAEGLFIYSHRTFPLGKKLRLEIGSDDNKTLSLEAMVIWLADKHLQAHCYPGMGIQFANVTRKTQKTIIAFIDSYIVHR